GNIIIAPPSLHKSGQQYQWAEGLSPWDVPLATMPSAVERKYVIETMPVKPPTQDLSMLNGSRAQVQHFLEQAIGKASTVAGRNDTGYWLACQLRDSTVGYDIGWTVMSEYQKAVARLDPDDVYDE